MNNKLKKCFILSMTLLLIISNSIVYATTLTPEEELQLQIDYLQEKYNSLYDNYQGTETELDVLETNLQIVTEQRDTLQSALDLEATPTPLPSNPKVKLVSNNTLSTIGGRTETAEFTVQNVGSAYAKNVLIQMNTPSDAPFKITFEKNSINSLYSNVKKTFQFIIEVDKDAKIGSYEVPIEYFYKDDDNNNLVDSDTLVVRIDNSDSVYGVALYDFKNSVEEVNAGDVFELTAKLENSSAKSIYDIKISIDGFDTEGISLSGANQSFYYQLLATKKYLNVDFKMQANKNMKSGTYPLTFNVSYKNELGDSIDNSFIYYVNVFSEDEEEKEIVPAIVEVRNIVSPLETLPIGQDFDISMTLFNTSFETAKNIKITTILADTNGAIVPKSSSIQQISTLIPNETRDVVFTFAGTEMSKTQNYTIGFNVEYENAVVDENSIKEISSFEQYAGVNIDNPEEEEEDEESDTEVNTSKPKIIVSKYSADPIIVQAGQNFDLYITFQNTHAVKGIENIKATLTSDSDTGSADQSGSVFIPVDSSNTFFIDSIPPKGEVEQKFTFYTIPNATPQNYIVGIDFEYEDAEHITYNSTEQVGINVKQVSKLEIFNMNVPVEAFMYEPFYVYFELYNTGKVTLNNLKVEMTGEFEAENAVSYYSNFSPGNNNYYEATVIPTVAGEQTGFINISYEDDTGELITEVREFNFNVIDFMANMGEMDMEFSMGDPMFNEWDMEPISPENQEKNGAVTIVSSIATIIVLCIILVVIRKKRKLRRERLELDE